MQEVKRFCIADAEKDCKAMLDNGYEITSIIPVGLNNAYVIVLFEKNVKTTMMG